MKNFRVILLIFAYFLPLAVVARENCSDNTLTADSENARAIAIDVVSAENSCLLSKGNKLNGEINVLNATSLKANPAIKSSDTFHLGSFATEKFEMESETLPRVNSNVATYNFNCVYRL